ncbi:MAG: septum formation initiator family protein [Planctomycetes bacterium]|uniref:FtsB family cell division protein n=1 Tax=Candidatus Wunengus sp. YC65 TaxID=3367701 RepID=UPI001D868219|nr:septum formation initiator family protein [Planctomycetota bacterium]
MQDAKIAVKKNKFFGKFVLMVFVTSCVVILFSSIITKVRQERFRMLESKTMLEKQAAQLEAENSILDREYSALKSDPVRIEQEARNQFGYIAPDEVTYSRYNFHIKGIPQKEPAKAVSQNRWKAFLFEGPFPWQFPAFIVLIASAYYLISYHCEYRKLHQSNC